MQPAYQSRLRSKKHAFTLIELLVVIAIDLPGTPVSPCVATARPSLASSEGRSAEFAEPKT